MYRMKSFQGYGLHIRSPLPLPELQAVQIGPSDVVVDRGAVSFPAEIAPGTRNAYRIRGDNACFYWQDVGTFLARGGSEIVVDAMPGVEDKLLRLRLLGPVLAAILQQRGHLLLHASVVGLDGEAVAFVGPRGSGKSTLAAALWARGCSLVADDVAVFQDVLADGAPTVLPGPSWFHLWPDTAAALGRDPRALHRICSDVEKRSLPAGRRGPEEPMALRRIYSLCAGGAPAIELLPAQDALKHLIANSYAALFDSQWFHVTGVSDFRQCCALVERVPVYCLTHPCSFEHLQELADLVVAH